MFNKLMAVCGVMPLLAFLLIQPVPQAASTGVITGKVIDPAGKPIADAVVTLARRRSDGREDSVTATSDKDGAFRAGNLAFDGWSFSVKASGCYEKKTWEPVGDGTQRLRIHPRVVLSPSSSNGTVELVLRPVSVLCGRVFTASGRLVADQRIWLVYPFSTLIGNVQKPLYCDAAGYYHEVLGYEGVDQFGVFDEVSGNYLPLTKFTYVGGKQTRRDIRLIRGAGVSGRVVAADGKTPVVHVSVGGEYDYFENGSPAFRAQVKGDILSVDWSGAKTDANGTFYLPLNPGMTYTLHAIGPTLGGTYYYNTPETAPKVRLRDGEQRNGLRLVLDDKYVPQLNPFSVQPNPTKPE